MSPPNKKHSQLAIASLFTSCLLCMYIAVGISQDAKREVDGGGFALLGFYISGVIGWFASFILAVASLFTTSRDHLFARFSLILLGVLFLVLAYPLWNFIS